jgi:hypothetical protein
MAGAKIDLKVTANVMLPKIDLAGASLTYST